MPRKGRVEHQLYDSERRGRTDNVCKRKTRPFFPFPLDSSSDRETDFSDLKFVRIAFPKYAERKAASASAVIVFGNAEYPLEPAEDINAIAFKTRRDRFMREKADTGNWQCLPHAISYARIPLANGDNRLKLNVKMIDGETVTNDVSITATQGKTYFHAFHTLN
jgi:hypothetical protein